MHICCISLIYVLQSSVSNRYICGAGNRKAVQMLVQPSLWCWRWFWTPQMSAKEADTNRCFNGSWLLSSIWFRTMWIGLYVAILYLKDTHVDATSALLSTMTVQISGIPFSLPWTIALLPSPFFEIDSAALCCAYVIGCSWCWKKKEKDKVL